jgi:DNA-binding NarL/FixJ family response regulator
MLHLLRKADKRGDEPAPTWPRPSLTERQLEVLALLDSGLTAGRIAERLELALPTVRNRIRAILIELGAHSQLEAVAEAKKLGLLDSD